MQRIFATIALTCLIAMPAAAQDCVGRNLIEELPADARAELDQAVAQVPFRNGLLWRATKGDQRITMVGTYHFQDPRHDAMMQRLQGAFADAALVLVEAGPEEEAQLTEALMADPSLTVTTDGPTLPERLSAEEWQDLSAAMAERGTPAVVTAKLKPWYVSMMLSISPCMLADIGKGGLDDLLIGRAEALDLPVRALEPWDTVFGLFADLTPEQEEDMLRAAMPAAEYADDYTVTLTDAYFAGDVWALWEFGRVDAYQNSGLTREEVDEQFTLAQTKLMDERNQSWIAPLEQAAAEAAAEGGGVLAGFGALHLPGQQGVLNLLEQNGWVIERLDDE